MILLMEATALVHFRGFFKPLQSDEVESIIRFIQKGGRVAVMMHIGSPLSNLVFRLGLGLSKTVLHERQNVIDDDINFRVTDLSPNPLFKGIDSIFQPTEYGPLIPEKPATAMLELHLMRGWT